VSEPPVPADPRRLRAADADRDAAAEVLRRAAAEGRITFDELDERISLAYAAKTFADLEALTSDLPGPGAGASAPVSRRVQPAALATGASVPKISVAVMSGTKRAGPWLVPPTYTAVAVMGGVELDLRHVTFSAPEVTIQAFCLMGGVSITVPDDVGVDVSGIGFMGGFDHQASGPGAPLVRIVGFALMGGVEVKRRPAAPAALDQGGS
jgi:uncharacterized protein DUF1707